MTASEQANSYILSPIHLGEFLDNHWNAHKWLHVPREQPKYFDLRISLDEIDRLVCGTRIPPSNLSMAINDDPLPLSSYCNGDFVDRERVLALHRSGATIILRSIEQWSPALAQIRCESEQLFGFEAQINVYLTPAQQKSTPPHWDTHDLFVLQLIGSKVWRLYAGDRTLPLENERFCIEEDTVGELIDEVTVNAGDTLFVPRGIIHEPVAASYSVHVSVGVKSLRWIDVCLYALQLAASRNGSMLRENIDMSDGSGANAARVHIESILADSALMDQALTDTYARQRLHHWTDRRGALTYYLNAKIPNHRIKFQRRAGQLVSLRELSDVIEVMSSVERLSLPKKMSDAVRLALTGEPFVMSALPELEDHERVALCMGLCEIGVLREIG